VNARGRARLCRALICRALAIVTALALLATARCGGRTNKDAASILLFTGTGTSAGDVAALETLLHAHRFGYITVSSADLNAMSRDDIARHRLLIVPGGNFVTIGGSLTPATTANIRDGVQHGLSYLGICAGAFLAGSFPPPYASLNLTSGVQFGFYAAVRDVHKAAVAITVAGGPTLDQYWEDGPQLSGWGAAVARYPDGTPAVVQGRFGSGWIVLTGVHPEAPDSWRRGMTFTTPASTDNAFAARLIESALNRTSLAHY
jgi:glutamine amidotransferase-like uncharacterized protein